MRRPGRWLATGATGIALVTLAIACERSATAPPATAGGPALIPYPYEPEDPGSDPAPCSGVGGWSGAYQFTVTIYSYDEQLAAYGIPSQSEQAVICQQWGVYGASDYSTRIGLDPATAPVDLSYAHEGIAAVESNGGYMAQYDMYGGSVEGSEQVGTTFEHVDASQEERDAAYACPWCGLIQDNNTSINTTAPSGSTGTAGATTQAAPSDSSGLKREHSRRLAKGLREVGRSPEGARRFKGKRQDVDVTLDFDPATEVLVAEEHQDRSSNTKAKHKWTKVGTKLVRSHSDIDLETTVDGKPSHQRMSIDITNVKGKGLQ